MLDSPLFVNAIRLKRETVPGFDTYPFCLPAIRGLARLSLPTAVTIFVGENGSGKSTLLEAVAAATGFNPEGGSRNMNFATRSSHSSLHQHLVVERGVRRPKNGFFLRAESFYNVATEIERLDSAGGPGGRIIDAYGGKSLHEQSHGESFMTLALERFRGDGLYLLDEPEAALSPTRQLALLVRIHDLVGMGSQFILATHSPLLLAFPDATIYSLDGGVVEAVEYEQTEHYQVTRRFLLDHRHALSQLLDVQ